MTKHWDAVQQRIHELSVVQKKPLQDVKAIMEAKYSFRASTRAYRMKLKEWGYLRHKSRQPPSPPRENNYADTDSEGTAPPDYPSLPAVPPWSPSASTVSDPSTAMLTAVLGADIASLEALLIVNANIVNYPLGLPFETGSQFCNNPILEECVISQHPGQTILDIASALPSDVIVQLLLNQGATGSTHPLGHDTALHNAIKNGRAAIVRALLESHSNPNGVPGNSWRPLTQAAFWGQPAIVRILLEKGAEVNQPVDTVPFKTALQLVLDRRAGNYDDIAVRETSEEIARMLLYAGTNFLTDENDDLNGRTPFETFLEPWKDNPLWNYQWSPVARDCLLHFVLHGANLHTRFSPIPCSCNGGETYQHQVLWHSSPQAGRRLIDSVDPRPGKNGETILHEIVGSCSGAKRDRIDTLRDIEVLIKRGADLKLCDKEGWTPLTICLQRCPTSDVLERAKLLLDRGADPDMPDRNGSVPLWMVARTFDEPLRLHMMEALVRKYTGQRSHGPNRWLVGYFPISEEPTFDEVRLYEKENLSGQTRRMIPKDARAPFQRAALGVATSNFLDAWAKRNPELGLQQRDQVAKVIQMRQECSLPPYDFDQAFVMRLLQPSSTPPIQHQVNHSANIPTSGPNAGSLLETQQSFNGVTNPLSATMGNHSLRNRSFRLGSPYQTTPLSEATTITPGCITPSETVADVTLMIREGPNLFEKVGRKYKCLSCQDGVLFSAEEYRKHVEEHFHTVSCENRSCRRRFCIAERFEPNSGGRG